MDEKIDSQNHDEYTKKIRRKIEDHLRKNCSKEDILALAIILKIEMPISDGSTQKQ